MSAILTQAQPPLEFIPPRFNPSILCLSKTILPWWLKFRTNIKSIQGENLDTFIELYEQFQTKKIRLLLAFRHPSTNDPLCMAYLFWRLAEAHARDKGIKLQLPIHAHFIYDRGIPLWAGEWVAWLYAKLGGSSIQRGKLDLLGLRTARHLFVNGDFPLAVAPEGATNGHNEIISPLEPGIAQLAFWCVEDLHKASRQEEVIILPIGIKYTYVSPPWQAIANLLNELERETGLVTKQELNLVDDNITPSQIELLYQRLFQLGEKLLTHIENFYRQFYSQYLSPLSSEHETETEPNHQLALRLQRILDKALRVAEGYFNLNPKGNLVDRCRRLEQAGWDYIYREEFREDGQISPFERGLANHVAEEASLQMWHMRIVESFVAVTGHYVKEKPSVERFAETVMILRDLVTRIEGGNPLIHSELGQQGVKLTMGEPMSVSSRWREYKNSRRQAVASLTEDLQIALQKMLN
jgi:1-acyl-sn-glycerol-3-phosphate acyltransferase